MNKILTVVVPSYNAAAYLLDCLDSLCTQAVLEDLEVLVINDGSTDDTPHIAAEYVKRYPDTVRLISKENGGHGSGINTGIEHALGTYFKVVDADDWVDAKAFAKLINCLKSSASDIVYSGFYWATETPGIPKESYPVRAEFIEPFEGVEYSREYAFSDIAHKLYIKMHNMTIRTELLKPLAKLGLAIDEHCFYVDMEYITYPIPFVKTVSFMSDFVYYYRVGRVGQSVSLDKMQRNIQNYDRVLCSLLSFYDRLQVADTRPDGNAIPCPASHKTYIEHMIARLVAGKLKIMLAMPMTSANRRTLMEFDRALKKDYPLIYSANINKSVRAIRSSGYLLYYPAAIMVRRKY